MAKKPRMIANFRRALKEVESINRSATLLQILTGLINGIKPFVNIILIAKIVEILTTTRNTKALIIVSALIVGLNFILTLAKNIVEGQNRINFWNIHFKEKHKINNLLYNCDYKLIETQEFDTLLRKYKEKKREIGHLSLLYYIIGKITADFVRLVIGAVLIVPVLKLTVVKTSDTFSGSPWFAVVIGGVIALAALIIFILQKHENKTRVIAEEKFLILSKGLNYYSDLINNYANGKEIRIFGAEKLIEKDATKQLLTEGISIRKKQSQLTGKSSALTAVVGVVAALGIYIFIGLKGLSKAFGISDLVLYLGSFMVFVESIIAFIGILTWSITVNKNTRYYFDIIDYIKPKEEKPIYEFPENYTVEFRNVSFKYDGAEDYALENVSFTINKGDKFAIVGQNGSGKTTFIKLLTKIYSDYEGDIFFCGHNLKDINDEQYNTYYSVIFQDFKIFAFTLKDNIISYGKCRDEDLQLSIQKAGLTNFVNQLENKEETFLTQEYQKDGMDISGGEGQKIAIARAFYKNADFVILDEPTAALDPMAESEFYASFNKFTENRTTLYISHRLSSCIFCPKIVVFDKGKIVQVGSHEELLKDKNCKYYELWTSQAQHYVR